MAEPKNIKDLYTADIGDSARGIWAKSVKDARAFMEGDFSPLERDGLIEEDDPKDNPIIRFSSLPEKIRFIKGRIFANPIEPKISPYEGEYLDESARMICDAVFRHEKRDERGAFALRLEDEIVQVVQDALVDGEGDSNHIIDDTLRDEYFFLGKPLHYRFDPIDVVRDCRSKHYRTARHIHLIHRYTESELRALYPGLFKEGSPVPPQMIDREESPDMFAVLETQQKKREWRQQILLPAEIQQEFGMAEKFMDKAEFTALLKEKKLHQPDRFGELNIEGIVSGLPAITKQDWTVYSTTWALGVDDPLLAEHPIGNQFSVEALQFFPLSQKPYAYGVPFYLHDLQNMEIVLHTVMNRIIQRLDNQGGFYDISAFTPEEVKALERNRIGHWQGVKVFGDDIQKKILPNSANQSIQFLALYLSQLREVMNNQFGTWAEQMGQAAFAGQSGTLAKILTSAGGYMFWEFVVRIESYLSRVFRRVLDLGVGICPPETMMIIAGESFQDRIDIIKDGSFYERIKRINVDVSLDMTTDSDKMLQKQMILDYASKNQMAPLTVFKAIGMKEPVRMAQEMDAWMARQSKAQMYAKMTDGNPALESALDKTIETFNTLTEGNTG